MIHRIGQDTLALENAGCPLGQLPWEKKKPKVLWEAILTKPILITPWDRTVGKNQRLFTKKGIRAGFGKNCPPHQSH